MPESFINEFYTFSRAAWLKREVVGWEADELILRLWYEWDVKPPLYWHPITGDARPPHTQAFQSRWFEREVGAEKLQRLLAARSIEWVFEMRELGGTYEIALDQMQPVCIVSEGFWFTERLDWLIYASHESSLTVGGAWLLPELCAAWPNWERRLWDSPFYD